ncbi:hypothetical protein BEWA_023560 [Theileria equi strain WA]|uniref:Uncharacterized protein n=1 Tax=Theileria equi strain WA TaxID=1537102 RepID=L0AV71_THEEQ|nr:hypothetical protein BEWA_023560 [Theileria equi strain WA]AFZ79507.1 hypothetical protein BEWA_023560 [Theileria equi strain WA]|eukprot:XP_004829173.1 hypothetical protein BEWA_023560 [Theileria equi strain WA]
MIPGKPVDINIGHVPGSASSFEGNNTIHLYDYGGSLNNEVSVTEYRNIDSLQGYIKCEHKPNNGNAIKAITYKRQPTTGLSGARAHTTVTVYFWEWDIEYTNPLLVKLGNNEKYYTTDDNTNWLDSTDNFNGYSLLEFLDEHNCFKNNAHVINLSERSANIGYQCLTKECGASITFVNNPYQYYSQTLHAISDGYIRRFKDKTVEQTGIGFPKDANQVYVYHYPSGPDGIPLLICLPESSGGWYKLRRKGSNRWVPVGDNIPSGPTDSSTILPLLKKINGESKGLTPGDIAGYVAEGLASVGMGGLGFWKGPAVLRGIISLVRTAL